MDNFILVDIVVIFNTDFKSTKNCAKNSLVGSFFSNFLVFSCDISEKITTFALGNSMVIVAQLVRALDCGSKGRGFEPRLSPNTHLS